MSAHRERSRPPPAGLVEELPAAKGTPVIVSADDLIADAFSSDEEPEEFAAFVRAERQRNVSPAHHRGRQPTESAPTP